MVKRKASCRAAQVRFAMPSRARRRTGTELDEIDPHPAMTLADDARDADYLSPLGGGGGATTRYNGIGRQSTRRFAPKRTQ